MRRHDIHLHHDRRCSYPSLDWALPLDAYSNIERSKGVDMSVSFDWLFDFSIGIATPPMLEISATGRVFVRGMVSLVWLQGGIPATRNKGKALEEIDEMFGDASCFEEQEFLRNVAQQHLAQH
ncbi:hexose carrier protein [Paraphaeosphaeria sporulosa]